VRPAADSAFPAAWRPRSVTIGANRATITRLPRTCQRPSAAFLSRASERDFATVARIGKTAPMDEAIGRLRALEIETPSWGYGNSGTRFHVYPWPGAARDVWEKVADAGLVHRLTACCPSVALHIPWDRVDDWPALAAFAAEQGVRIGAINPNVF